MSFLTRKSAALLWVSLSVVKAALASESYASQLERLRKNELAISDQLRHIRSRYGFGGEGQTQSES